MIRNLSIVPIPTILQGASESSEESCISYEIQKKDKEER